MSILERCLPPSGLVSFIIDSCTHPTTLIIGGTSAQFVQQWHANYEHDDNEKIDRKTTLLEVAVARHIRVVFVPSVAHLRGFLAAFDPATSSIPPPPSKARRKTRGRLIIYNLLRLHRETSEWSAQGLGATAAVLDETGYRTGMGVCIVERREGEDGESPWTEQVPILSTSARRQLEKAGYPLRMEGIRSVLGRWFTFTDELGGEEELEEEQVMKEVLKEKEAEEQQAVEELKAETEKNEEKMEEEEENAEVVEEKTAEETEAEDIHQDVVVMEEEEQAETPPEEVALILPPEDASSPLSSPPSSPLSQRPSPSPPPPPSLPPAQPQQPVRTFVKDSEDEDNFSDDDF